MKIALIGHGKMGREIDRLAGDSVVARIGPGELSRESVADADVCIEFTTPSAAPTNIRQLIEWGKPVVVGTTGWTCHDEIRALADRCGVGVLVGENFSLGVQRFIRVAADAAAQLAEFDVAGWESHHRGKGDHPSGTGRKLAEALVDARADKTEAQYHLDGPIDTSSLHFTSVRCGAIPGTHEVVFSAAGETVTLTHTSYGREAFARGALAGAAWIVNHTGYHHVSELLEQEAFSC